MGFVAVIGKQLQGVVVFMLEVVLDLLRLRQPIFLSMAFLSKWDRLLTLRRLLSSISSSDLIKGGLAWGSVVRGHRLRYGECEKQFMASEVTKIHSGPKPKGDSFGQRGSGLDFQIRSCLLPDPQQIWVPHVSWT
ncbi:hypothetical protein OIU85_012574 [Salix viminalis]|uniref:Uncharacterized protein n=1 Tax=Salix viminalis TaxID=40686 RepID=A0A9Q0SDC9_SALVM|nr:hypothetical protein OIU85_012574 [Salix viminalis]